MKSVWGLKEKDCFYYKIVIKEKMELFTG